MSALTAERSERQSNIDNDNDVDQSGPSTIPLYLINGVATIWDAQTAATLHCVHAVSGLRVGTLPGVAQQNGFLGLPVTLMREETAYLVQQGIAHLVPLNISPTLPSLIDIEQHTINRRNHYRQLEQMTREAEAKRVAGAKEAFEKGGEKAKAKRAARAKAKAEIKAKAKEKAESAATATAQVGDGDLFGAEKDGHEEMDMDTAPLATPSQAERKGSRQNTSTSTSTSTAKPSTEKEESSQSISSSTTITQITNTTGTTSSPSPGYFHSVPSHPPFPPLSAPTFITSLPHSLFPFPTTDRDRALVEVYTTLQKRGYRMGLGPRFGGEYLIYPGDYLRYHAHFTSQVIVDDQPIRPAEIVAWGRLGTGTKKAGLLCCYDQSNSSIKKSRPVQVTAQEGKGEENDDGVEFYSLEWANFG